MRPALLVTANVLIPFAVLIFATGFFPYKPFIPGLASHNDFEEYGVSGSAPAAIFDKLIFMVVDALRSDFVFANHSGFTYTQQLISSGEALPFTAHASSPTITMPKVKAITTGSVPSFLDVILNFAESDTSSTLADQDTWLAQIRAGPDGKGGGRLVMYGDDTWLKLFPQTFVRADGTSSFFVSDFTEVDYNVTRHVPTELRNADWDAMIMHYLGLDHIGHKAGPWSPNMLPKQREMDDIVKTIYESMQSQSHLNSTLLILCGDHGMTDGGNHGGSNPGETSPAVVFVSPKLRDISSGHESPTFPASLGGFDFYDRIAQSDLAPTISSLLGRPISKNNLGILVQKLLPLWLNGKDQIELLLRNALQILSIVRATFPSEDFDSDHNNSDCQGLDSDAEALACEWRLARSLTAAFLSSEESLPSSIKALYSFLKHGQEILSSTASNYDLGCLVGGIALAAISSILLCVICLAKLSLSIEKAVVMASVTGIYGIMMFASSYVEEEQQFWYWIAAGWIGLLNLRTNHQNAGVKVRSPYSHFTLAVLFLHRFAQRWNQTGQKHVGSPDIVSGYLARQPISLWLLVGLTYLAASVQSAYSLSQYLGLGPAFATIGSLSMAFPSVALKLSFIASDAPELLSYLSAQQVEALRLLPILSIARLLFAMISAFAIVAVIRTFTNSSDGLNRRSVLHSAFSLMTLLLLTQIRTQNIPLFLFFMVQHKCLQRLDLSPFQITLNTLILAHTSFFALGNSNAISSVDLSNGYNGVSGFNVVAVGLLVFTSNWAGPIFWAMSGIVLLSHSIIQRRNKQSNVSAEDVEDSFSQHLTITSLFVAVSTLAMMIACTVLRTHLFIWTVFSPKYLYTMAWSLGYHYLVTIGLCGGIWRLTSHLS